jgi:GNAT superfamily N-acetyltransferase
MFFTKQASAVDMEKVAQLLSSIYEEEPSYWPYGLCADQFDGGLYLISKSAAHETVGFVGWQERREDARDVGYYAIGVLPEYRRQGFAKAAVQAIIREKSAGVDEVRAMVCAHNEPSKRLARSLPVTLIEKVASIGSMAKAVGGGALTAGLIDLAVNKDKGALGALANVEGADPWTAPDFALNTAAGAIAAPLLRKNLPLAAFLTSIAAAKTIASPAVRNQRTANDIAAKQVEVMREGQQRQDNSPLTNIPKSLLLGALGLGVGGLGVAAYAAKRKADVASEQAEASRAGRVKVTLPTKKPGDAETTLDIPMDDVRLSQALRDRLGRDTRRRLYAETRERTKKRKPMDPNNLTEKEQEELALAAEEELLSKESSIASLVRELHPAWFTKSAAPQAAVPTPPQPGVNPALRMAQQSATANSIQPSTEANPQIMEAQQKATSAEQAAQQQVAQMEQQFAQQQMDQQQKFQEQIAQAEQARRATLQENEILKLNVEKVKMQKEIAETKFKAKDEIAGMQSAANGKADGDAASAVDALLQRRIERLRSKSATVVDGPTYAPAPGKAPTGPFNPVTGRNDPPPSYNLRPGVLNEINKNEAYSASGRLAPVGMYRASYGGIGDFLYDKFLRSSMTTPSLPSPTKGLSMVDMLNNPDRIGMLSGLMNDRAAAANQVRL